MTQAVALAQQASTGVSQGFKNRIINGAMVIDQRNAGASGTASGFTTDRWQYQPSQANKITWQQNAGSVTPPAGFSNYLGVTSSSAYSVLAGDYFLLTQRIEGYNIADLNWGTANAKTVTASFWVRSSLTGTFGGSINDKNSNYSYPFTYTISSANTWEYKTLTIVGPTSGTFGSTNDTGLVFRFSLGQGSTYTGTPNAWTVGDFYQGTGSTSVVGTNGATFYITGVQLEVGSTATNFDFRDYTTELALCQRYLPCFVIGGGNNVAVGTNYSSGNFITSMVLPVPARVAPTGLVYNGTITTCIVYFNASASTATGISWNGGTPSTVSFNVTSGATTVGSGALFSASGANVSLYFTGCEL
jgi:hypothetical protein